MSNEDANNQAFVEAWNLEGLVSELRGVRQVWRDANGRQKAQATRELPSKAALEDIVHQLSGALFPMRLGPVNLRQDGEDFFVGATLCSALQALLTQVTFELHYQARLNNEPRGDVRAQANNIINQFAAQLPALRRTLDTDVLAAYYGDPAAISVDEVLLCYPGILAVMHHRIAHLLYKLGVPLVARVISESAHSKTGIDIHPGAQIGSGFFIDHGTGVVIGETTIIGERVRLYQNVTLGAVRFPADEDGRLEKGHPRHPIIEDDVVIYAGATLLGRITVGANSVIGGNVWLTRSVPANSAITQANLRREMPDCPDTQN
ncbi:MAG TPA: serine O-acetyltransferase EpsC [Alcanivoracaceae bacterium]|nr:serine O-acetyltransferase EpsC [Alcanivoracaceae bacterium]